jgi:hypothetical protein
MRWGPSAAVHVSISMVELISGGRAPYHTCECGPQTGPTSTRVGYEYRVDPSFGRSRAESCPSFQTSVARRRRGAWWESTANVEQTLFMAGEGRVHEPVFQ